MSRIRLIQTIKSNGSMMLGAVAMSFATNCFFEPMELVPGGITGVGILVKELTGDIVEGGVPLWLTNLVCNIPLFILAGIWQGKDFFKKAIWGTLWFTLVLGVMPVTALPTADMLLNTLIGALFMGIGLGLVFGSGSTTGGMDLLAVLVGRRYRRLSEAKFLAIFDGIIVFWGVYIFGIGKGMYAMVAILVVMLVSDYMINGARSSKTAWIITDFGEQIGSRINRELGRGVTKMDCFGMHTGHKHDLLLSVVEKRQANSLKDIVFQEDSGAFIVISDSAQIYGEGFSMYENTKKKAFSTIKRPKN